MKMCMFILIFKIKMFVLIKVAPKQTKPVACQGFELNSFLKTLDLCSEIVFLILLFKKEK